MKINKRFLLVLVVLLVASIGLAAQDSAVNSANQDHLILQDHEKKIDLIKTNLDYVWVLLSAILVFFMQAGFMALESGMARSKNSINVAIKNLTDFVLGVIGFWLIGFGLMFGKSWNGFLGVSDFLITIENPWVAAFFMFQAVFVGTAATIDSGAVCERAKLKQYILLSFLLSVIIYPIFGHWCWGSFLHGTDPAFGGAGWLEVRGFKDFAGSSVVHSVGGWMALAGVIVVGPRIGKFVIDKDGKKKPRKIAPGDMRYVFLGTFILFFGWYGFNCGSTLAATSDIAPIALNTTLAACFGCLSSSVLSWMFHGGKKIEGEMIANGVLAGLVGITAGCAFVNTTGAMIIGLISGIIVFFGSIFLEKILKLDDVVGAIPVHAFCGAWGTLAVGFFIRPEMLGDMTRLDQIKIQFIGVGACFVWAFGLGLLFYFLVDRFAGGIRVSVEDEEMGLNMAEHGATSSILELANTMNEITQSGDFSSDKKVHEELGTEIGDLARLFNQMVVKIREGLAESQKQKQLAEKMLKESEEQREKVLEAQRELQKERAEGESKRTEIVNQTRRKLSDVNQRIEGVRTMMSNTSTVTQEMSDMFSGLMETLQGMLSSLTGAHEQLNHLEGITSGTSETMEKSMAAIGDLQNVAKEIQEMVTFINEIADKTHVLSINSSIEAARYGNKGNGFVVISKEVRDLSKQTSDTANEISNKMLNIEERVSGVSQSMTQIMSILGEIQGLNKQIISIVDENKILSNSIQDKSSQTISAVNSVSEDVRKVVSEAEGLYEIGRTVQEEIEEI